MCSEAQFSSRRHKDLKLLLNLLAETSGLPESFRILTLFDKKFQSLWKPQVRKRQIIYWRDVLTIMHTGGNDLLKYSSRLSKIFLFQNLRFEEYETVIPNQKERDHFSILLLQNKYLGHWTFPSLSPLSKRWSALCWNPMHHRIKIEAS